MSFLDGMFGKSKLVDTQTYLSNVPGSLVASPQPGFSEDGNFSVWFLPENKGYLLNRNKTANRNGLLELKVRLLDSGKQAFLDALRSVTGQKASFWGVLINDDAKEGKAEVRPLDAIFLQLPVEKYPVWVGELAKNISAPETLQVFKVFAASDASTSSKPPRVEENREVKINIPYPTKPGPGNREVKYEIKSLVNVKGDFMLNNEVIRDKLVLSIQLKSAKEDGPVLWVADIAVFWN